MGHSRVEAAEAVLDQEFKVLDKGFVRLVDYMGSDERIVQAARVSYGEGTKTLREDAGLIDYLLRNAHTSPFEQVVFTFHLKMPIFIARQWLRHRTARLNEISGRYSVMPEEFYLPESKDICAQSSDNKQGRSQEAMAPAEAAQILENMTQLHEHAYQKYQTLLEQGTAREIARIVLPLSLYTQMYWQIDLHNLLHFLRLRLDAHAQREIRAFAGQIAALAAKVCPLAFASFENHVRQSLKFSGTELQGLQNLLAGGEHGLKGRQARIFEEKIKQNPIK